MGESEISALRLFLEYGPIGLAGLVFILAIIALLVGNPSNNKSSILKWFLAVGAVCFLAATFTEFFSTDSEHELNVNVVPDNLDSIPHSAAPKMRFGSTEFVEGEAQMVRENVVITFDISGSVTNAENELKKFETRLDFFKVEAAKLGSAKDAISELQSQAATTKELREIRALNRIITQFLQNVQVQ